MLVDRDRVVKYSEIQWTVRHDTELSLPPLRLWKVLPEQVESLLVAAGGAGTLTPFNMKTQRTLRP